MPGDLFINQAEIMFHQASPCSLPPGGKMDTSPRENQKIHALSPWIENEFQWVILFPSVPPSLPLSPLSFLSSFSSTLPPPFFRYLSPPPFLPMYIYLIYFCCLGYDSQSDKCFFFTEDSIIFCRWVMKHNSYKESKAPLDSGYRCLSVLCPLSLPISLLSFLPTFLLLFLLPKRKCNHCLHKVKKKKRYLISNASDLRRA